jgi:Inner membrane protein YgaP-like, transmembrane domain
VVVLASLALAITVSLNWLWLTAFVGANLFQSGFTRICPLESILRKTSWFRSSVRPA